MLSILNGIVTAVFLWESFGPCVINYYPSDPNRRMGELLNNSEELQVITEEWERIWFEDQPSNVTRVCASEKAAEQNGPAELQGKWERIWDKEGTFVVCFEKGRLHLTAIDLYGKTLFVMDGDYSQTKDCLIYGVITSIGDAKLGDPDDPFTFRLRLDDDTLTVKQVNVYGKKEDGWHKAFEGRYKRAATSDKAVAWPKDWSQHLGKTITLEGIAENAKLGPLLSGKDNSIWIDGLDGWPEGVYQGGNRGKKLRVTGTVIVRDDLPVFVSPKEGAIVPQGIPVPLGTDLKEARKRYLLRDARWVVLEE
jgi:hypothetical protein